VNRSGSRGRIGADALLERTLAHARMAREPSTADKERVLTTLRDYLGSPSHALQDPGASQGHRPARNDSAPQHDGAPSDEGLHDDGLHDDGLHDEGLHDDGLHDEGLAGDSLSGVRQIVHEAARPAVSPLARWARPWSVLPASVQKLMWVGAVTGGLGFWLGSPASGGPAPVAGAPRETPARTAAAASRAPDTAAAEGATPHASLPRVVAPPLAASSSDPRRALAPLEPSVPAGPAPSVPLALPAVATLPSARAHEPAHTPLPRAHARSSAAGALAAVSVPAVPAPAVPAPAALAPAVPLAAAAPIAAPPAASPAPLGSGEPSLGASSSPRASAPSPGDAGFLEAVRQVQRAQRALESGAPGQALSLLDGLDARFPAALLNEERLATRALALCASGAVARAKRVAAELGARNPSSIYAARIAQSCAGPGAPPAPRR